MRLPRDPSGRALAQALSDFVDSVSRQSASHLRLTTQRHGEHHITVPAQAQLRVGTLAAIPDEVAKHAGIDRSAFAAYLFG